MEEKIILLIGIVSGLMTILGIDGILKYTKINKKGLKIHSIELKDEYKTRFINVIENESINIKNFYNYIIYKLKNGSIIFPFFNMFGVNTYPYELKEFFPNKFDLLFRFVFYISTIFALFFMHLTFYVIFSIILLIDFKAFINRTLKKKELSFYYDKIYRVDNDYYICELSGKKGLLSNSLKEILPCVFDRIKRPFIYQDCLIGLNLIKIELDNKAGFVNYDGSIVLPVKYNNYSIEIDCSNKTIDAGIGNKKYRISKYGKRIIH